MKRLKSICFLLFTLIVSCACLVACGGTNPPPSEPPLPQIEGVTFTSETYTYDGLKKELLIEGYLPQGVSVSYQNNEGTNVGVYNAKAILTGEGYQTKTLQATLTINKATYDMSQAKWNYSEAFIYDATQKTLEVTGLPDGVTVKSYTGTTATTVGSYTAIVTFNYDTTNYHAPTLANCPWSIEKATFTGITLDGSTDVEYDTLQHGLQVMGNVPAEANVVITYNGEEISGVSAVGEYKVVATLTSPNYHTLTIEKTLKIVSTEEQLYSVRLGDTVFFQNNLDSNKLYKYNTTLSKVNNDIPSQMIAVGDTLWYTSNNLLFSSIKSLTENQTTASKLYDAKASSIATDGTYIYYAVTDILASADAKGIWKLKLDGSEEAPSRITADKADYLVYYDGYLYYSNLSEGDALYKISTSSTEGKGSLLWEEKVSYIIEDSGVLYFNSTATTLGGVVSTASAIRKYTISSGNCVKLTSDAGKYLTKVGSYIYYINNDKINSVLFGDGIYKISVMQTSDNSLPGYCVISTENDGFSSLTSDGDSLFYYMLNDKHFYEFDLSTEKVTDLMDGFVVVDDSSLSGYAKITEYNGELYFANIRDNGYLYKYNPTTKACFKVLDDTVSGVYFNGNYMYYSTNVLENYALWRMDLSTNVSTKISSKRCDSLIFVGEYIYYIQVGSTYNNYVYKMGLDGSSPTKVFDKSLWVSDFYLDGEYIYLITNAGFLGADDYIYRYKLADGSTEKYTFESQAMTVKDGVIYYYDHNDNTLNCYKNNQKTVLVSGVTINDMEVIDGKLYYSSTGTNGGFFAYDLSTKQTTKISSTNADAIMEYNGKVYFMQVAIEYVSDKPVINGSSDDDGRLCCYDGQKITELN